MCSVHMVCTTSRAFWGENPECPASSPPGYSPSKKSQLPASQRPAPGSRPLATLDLAWLGGQWARSFRGAARSGTRGSRPPRPFVLFPLPRKRQRPRAAEERATPLELTAAGRRGPSAPPGLRPLFYTQFHVVGTTSFALKILILKFSKDQNFW